jgi:DNA-binding CsgD family transcriptional regulator
MARVPWRKPPTRRQLHYLAYKANGRSIQHAANQESVSVQSVKNALAAGRRRTGAYDTYQLVALSVAARLIVLHDGRFVVAPPAGHKTR